MKYRCSEYHLTGNGAINRCSVNGIVLTLGRINTIPSSQNLKLLAKLLQVLEFRFAPANNTISTDP